eukprot:Phypoly_transcript_16852.p1 GENE.Phypoly_transcript_16852~~Phypoly_transcript_16852.p1  ORF type:complete len:263 (+),score=25.98 Phypoly_transcript_16852:62-790(+)
MDRGTGCLWALIVLTSLICGCLGGCGVGYQCTPMVSDSAQSNVTSSYTLNECLASQCNKTVEGVYCNCTLKTSAPTPAPSANNGFCNTSALDFSRNVCDNLLNYYDLRCADPLLYFSRLGIAILAGCCSTPKAKLLTCNTSSSCPTTPPTAPPPTTTAHTTTHKTTTTTSTTSHSGSTTSTVDRGDKFHLRKKVRLLTARETALMALCGMGGIAVIAIFLYFVNPTIGGCLAPLVRPEREGA